MAHVVRLVADPERTPLDGATVAALQRALNATARRLAEDEACEFPVEAGYGGAARARAEAALGDLPQDVGVVPAAARRKRLLVSDIGFNIIQANRLETLNGRLTGRLLGPIRSPSSKLVLLRQLTRVLRLQPAETLAVGDDANDLPMLRDAGLGVAFWPTPAVAAVAPVVIRRGDLRALL